MLSSTPLVPYDFIVSSESKDEAMCINATQQKCTSLLPLNDQSKNNQPITSPEKLPNAFVNFIGDKIFRRGDDGGAGSVIRRISRALIFQQFADPNIFKFSTARERYEAVVCTLQKTRTR